MMTKAMMIMLMVSITGTFGLLHELKFFQRSFCLAMATATGFNHGFGWTL